MRPDFASTNNNEIRRTDRFLVTNGVRAMIELRATRKRNRDYLIGDLRKSGYAYLDMRSVFPLFDAPPPTMRNQLGESSYRDRRGMHSTEIGIVRPALFGSSVRWRPGRSMVNFYTQETAKTCEYSYALSTLSFGR